jgi:hypothetical protein
MATKDSFRLVPADRAERPEQPGSAPAWRRDWRREMIKAGVLGATAAAIALAAISFETPGALVTNATAFFASLSTPQDGKVEQVPIAQSSAETQAGAGVQTSAEAQASPPGASQQVTSAPTASEAAPSELKAKASEVATSQVPADNNATAPVKTADQGQPGTGQASTEDLLGRFQAWAARDNTQAEAQPAQQPAPAQPEQATVQETVHETVQATQAKPDPAQDAGPVQDARAEVEPAPDHRAVRRVKHARAEVRAKQDIKEDYKQDQKQAHRAKLRREQDARLQAQRFQDVREQERPQERPIVQPARAPSFLESLGLRDY